MIEKLTFNYENLNFDLRFDSAEISKRPLVIFFHGFKSFRNWGFIPYICSFLAENGYLVINLDFEYNGIISENPINYDVDKFSKNTVSKELENASKIIELSNRLHNIDSHSKNIFEDIKGNSLINLKEVFDDYWNGEINLIGHSRGSAVALLSALRYNEIKKIALLAPIGTFERFSARIIKKWKDEGFLEFNDSKSNQKLKMGMDYLDDIERNRDNFDLMNAAKKIENPVIIIYGSNDLSVSEKEVRELYESLTEKEQNFRTYRNFVFLEKANHLFNINHPFDGSNSYLDKVCDLLVTFLDEK